MGQHGPETPHCDCRDGKAELRDIALKKCADKNKAPVET